MKDTFSIFNLNEGLIRALNKEQIFCPTEIQKLVIPPAIDGKDLIAQSETGTGKTLAYLIPLFERLERTGTERQAVILAPSHELIRQIEAQVKRLNSFARLPTRCVTLLDNESQKDQQEALAVKPGIIIGNPNRVQEMIRLNAISGKSVEIVILDEADHLMTVENTDTTLAILRAASTEKQVMLFSASISQRAIDKLKPLLKDVRIIKTAPAIRVPDTIDHYFFTTAPRDRTETLKKLLTLLDPPRALVFTSRTDEIDTLAGKMSHYGFAAASIHGKNKKGSDRTTLRDFRDGKVEILVLSDIAARGLHVDGITHIFSMEPPSDPRDYLHRSGRTGRYDQEGVSVIIATEAELPQVRAIEKALNINIQPQSLGRLAKDAERMSRDY